MGNLSQGEILITKAGHKCKIIKSLGEGSQGEVFQVEVFQVGVENKSLALKWYNPAFATAEQNNNLQKLIEKGAPNQNFLWPFDIIEKLQDNSLGYLMPIRPSGFHDLNDHVSRRVETTFRNLITACMNLCDSFAQLHLSGLCYADISFNNVFFNEKNGDILICDNDNVTIDRVGLSGVIGTPGFKAPEIELGKDSPNSNTDYYSLAVLLFQMLMYAHPLDGKLEVEIHCKDEQGAKKLYGENPVFIWDPENESNRPVRGIHDNAIIYWPIYPQILHDKFTQVFTKGLRNPGARVMETEWRNTMATLLDSIFKCTCGAENFYDIQKIKNKQLGKCWNCQKDLRLPPRIKIGGKFIVMLNPDTKLYPHHIQDKPFDFSQPVAEVVQHPQNPNIWGLKNLTNENWTCKQPKGSTTIVPPGKSLTLSAGANINFGKIEGVITG